MLNAHLFLHTQLVIEFGPPPVGIPLLAAHHDGISHYGRMLGRSSSRDTDKDKSGKPGKRRTSSKSAAKSSKSSKVSDDGESNDGSDGDGTLPDIPVCPVPNLNMDVSMAVSLYAEGDSAIVAEAPNKSFGSDVILELSPPQCGDMQAMITFDVNAFVSVEYASLLIHVIEGSDLSGATFLHAIESFEEEDVTWRNAPEYDRVIGSLNTIKNGMVSLHPHFFAVTFALPYFNTNV
jgi:hypothetical protein